VTSPLPAARPAPAAALGTLGALVLSLVIAGTAIAAEPGATPGTGGDPRSPGQGPGLVGDPLFAIGVVVIVALVSIGLTLGYVRLTGSRGGSRST
jgi:hypothetical protein